MKRLLQANIFALCFLLSYIVVSFILSLIFVLFPNLPYSLLLNSAGIYLLSFGLSSLIYAWIVTHQTGESLSDFFGFHRLSLKSTLLVIAAAICVQPCLMLISAITQLFFQNVTTSSMIELAEMPLWAYLLTSAVLPAFFEELVCRGAILGGYRQTPLWYALLIPALFFGLLHLNFQQAIYACAAGVFLALLVRATGSLWASILAHFTINGLQSLTTWLLAKAGFYTSSTAANYTAAPIAKLLSLLPFLFLTAIALPLLILCIRKLFKIGAPQAQKAEIGWHRGAWPMYTALGFLLVYTFLTEFLLRLL